MMTTKDAAAILGISTSRLCLLLRQGRVKGAVKKGRVWMIRLHQGQLRITDKHKGPSGSWTRVKVNQKKQIHVHTQAIRANLNKTNQFEPVIIVRNGGDDNFYTNHVEFFGLCKVVYQPHKPLNGGARVWIETYATVSMPYGFTTEPPSTKKAKTG